LPFDGHLLRVTYTWARRIIVAVIGFTVLAVGVAMIVLPGPAVVVIPPGSPFSGSNSPGHAAGCRS
jgi:tellurite resistance protein TerC